MSLIAYLTRIHFADRVVDDALAVELRALGVRRPAVVTDAAGEADDLYDRICDALPPEVRVLPLRRAEAAEAAVLARLAAAAGGCDGVIGLGGPVALNLARALGRERAVPVIALPTTTASVGIGPLPRALGGPAAPVPALVLCDPTLTMAQDAADTAAAGMDALTHCIEAWLGTTWNPPADGMALDGARRAAAWLPRAVAEGQDPEARRELLAAALNAGLASQKGLGGVHALAHALEAEAGPGVRHGWLHAALLPPVMAFNAPAVADRFAPLAAVLGLAAGDLPGALAGLGVRLGLPRGVAGLGLGRGALARVAARAAEDPANLTNPRHAVAADYLRMLEAAL
jgi:alcohol dehydrogenase class IV